MDIAVRQIAAWVQAAESWTLVIAGALIATSFLLFNTVRITLYLPQLRTCLRDTQGCPTINLSPGAAGSWLIGSLVTTGISQRLTSTALMRSTPDCRARGTSQE